jgi:hypothetical protein
LAIEEVANVGKWISRTIYPLKGVVVLAFGIAAFLAVSIECLAGVEMNIKISSEDMCWLTSWSLSLNFKNNLHFSFAPSHQKSICWRFNSYYSPVLCRAF